jgi:N-acetyl-anhydromuramyl-L-alanine amidase AmpD
MQRLIKGRPGRFRRIRALVRNPRLRSRFNRFQAKRFARRVAKRTTARYASKAPRYPGAIWIGQTNNTSGPFSGGQPRFIIQHYTASGAGINSAKFLFGPHSPASSAHFLVDRDGTTYQLCAIDLKAWHAGKSTWKDKDGKVYDGLNSYAIGVEHANYGWLEKGTGKRIRAVHKNEKTARTWDVYPEAQIAASLKLTAWLKATIPTIHDTMGHDDISPGRKQDPGPAFPMDRYKALFKPKAPAPAEPAVAALGFASIPEGKETMTNAHDGEDLSEGEAAVQLKTATEQSDEGDEPINPPLLNQEQVTSLLRTTLQLLGAVLVTRGIMTPADVASMIDPIMVLIGAAMTLAVTWWGIRARSSKNIVRSARRIERHRSRDGTEEI